MPDTRPRVRPPLGIDVYSIRSSGWSAERTLDYCAALGAEVVHFSEPRFLGSLDREHLAEIRARADDLSLVLEVGMGSICSSSASFQSERGAPVDQLTRMLHVAAALGSHTLRCYLGTHADRGGSLARHIDNTVATCRAVETVAVDLGIRLAIENHAGDLQSAELCDLIERAGPHFVGALFDAGNAAWALEVPGDALETIAPYVVTSGIRDSRVWETPLGAAVEWVALGQGDADISHLAGRFAEICPGKPFSLEIILFPPLELTYRRPGFWEDFGATPRIERFEGWVRRSTSRHGPPDPRLDEAEDDAAERERIALEGAMAYARNELGLGRVVSAGIDELVAPPASASPRHS